MLKTFTFTGVVYRAHDPRWSFLPDSGDGAKSTGGRFNEKGTKALYTSLSLKTAWLEAQQGFAKKAQPMTICAYDVHMENMIDLREPKTLKALNLTLEKLSAPWLGLKYPPTQLLSRQLIDKNVSGILTPSFVNGANQNEAINAVFWRWNNTPPYQVLTIDDSNRLPKNSKSWL